jgi:hypothetical protein
MTEVGISKPNHWTGWTGERFSDLLRFGFTSGHHSTDLHVTHQVPANTVQGALSQDINRFGIIH